MSKIALVASYWTIAGVMPGTTQEYSRFPFVDRVKAAAKAGFTGMGFWHADLQNLLTEMTFYEMKRILDDHGIAHVEVEFLLDWFLDGERKARSDLRKQFLFDAARVLRAKYIKVGDFFQEKCTVPQLIDSFATLCKEAAEHGTNIAYEPMAAATISSLEDCLAMVEGAGAANGGLALDLWHVVNQGESFQAIARMPGKHLLAVELDDGFTAKTAPFGRRASDPRLFCGEGDFDIRGFIAAVEKTGYSGAWGIEVISPALATMSLDEVTRKAFDTTRVFF